MADSCVARAMKPGVKVDTMLILQGKQGIGKSTALAGDGFHCDSAIDFGTKDACQTIQGVWIYELAELDALLRRESSIVKGFRPFTMNDLLESALGLAAQARNPRVTARVSHILDELGYERRKRSTLPRTHYYARKGTEPSRRHTVTLQPA